MRLFITGATGLIGRRLVLDRLQRGDRVVLLSRDADRATALFAAGANPNVEVVEGDPGFPGAWQQAVDDCDGVVHLAGAGVVDHRWSPAYKRVIVNSRIDSTHQVVEAISMAGSAPSVLVCASAVGWYGDTGDRETDEQARPATGDFLGELTVNWERGAEQAEARAGVRTVMLRTGIVLDPRGGILAKLRGPFRCFIGGPVGSGRQYVPWIHWRDLVGLIDLALSRTALRGPMNGTAPNPVTNRVFSREFGRSLRRPSWLPVPSFMLRLVLGEIARYVTMSQRIVPAKALAHGYRFVYPELTAALESLLSAPKDEERVRASQAEVAPMAAPALVAAPENGPAEGEVPVGPGPSEPIRLLAIGVDGTMLRSDGRLPQGVVHATRAAQRAGCVVVLATARPPRSVRPILEALDIVGPVITYNGAVLWNPLDAMPQYHESMPPELAREIIDAARAAHPDIIVGIEILDRWFTDRLDPAVAAESRMAVEPDGIGPLDGYLTKPVTQVNLYGSHEEIEAVRSVMQERFWRENRIALFQPEPSLLQIMHPLVDKAIALQRIASRMKVSREAVMTIGDGANDRGMIEWAGFGVAVGTATPDVKALAEAVVPGNDDHGVARAIQRYVLARR